MISQVLNNSVSEVTLNAMLSIAAFIITFIALVLSILFYSWARKEQKEANNINNKMMNQSHNLINIINEKLCLLSQSTDNTINILIKYLMDTNSNLMANRIEEKLTEGLNCSNENKSEKCNSIINASFIEEVSKDNIIQIQETSYLLSQLDINTLSVLYSIWTLQNRGAQTTIENIIIESSLTEHEIVTSKQTLVNITLLNFEGNINPKYLRVLNNLFVIDEYTGMRFAEKINALKELIQRIPKVT